MQPSKDGINIAFPEGFNQPTFELIITEGATPVPLIIPKSFSSFVALTAIGAFLKAGKFPKDPTQNNGVVLYGLQPEKLYIKLFDDPNNPMANVLEASLQFNPEFIEWGINKEKYFGVNQLIKLVRRQAINFANPNDTVQIIKDLQNFEVKFTSHKAKEDDRKGNTKQEFKTTLDFTKGAITSWTWALNIPLFKSTAPVKINVDIEIDESNGDPVISFYSLETELLVRSLGADLVMNEVNELSDYYVCLEQN